MKEGQATAKKENNGYEGILKPFIPVLKSWQLYAGAFTLFAGAQVNYISQAWLNDYVNRGNTLPELNDLVLDRLPLYDLGFYYDLFSFIPIIIVIVYIIHKNDHNRIPFILLLSGIIEIIRGIFVVLTPLGNPPGFLGSGPPFNGFSLYELGVYPSGHAGSVFLLLLMVRSNLYKWLIFVCLMTVIVMLLLTHAHYSIDILSGLLFAYAVNAFGNKYFKIFELKNGHTIKVKPD